MTTWDTADNKETNYDVATRFSRLPAPRVSGNRASAARIAALNAIGFASRCLIGIILVSLLFLALASTDDAPNDRVGADERWHSAAGHSVVGGGL